MLALQKITHAYGDKLVLHNISLQMIPGEILCLLGPSGCGKTTLLRIIVGLETGYQGEMQFAGKSLTHLPVHARDFGLMFQDFALFPHKNVLQNITFGLKMRGAPAKEQIKRAAEMLSLVGLSGFEKRDVTSLSGGEKQRVALARSLAPAPRLLLLDEPLGALDASLREKLMLELRDIIKSVGLTAIYVTHDRQEAFAVADRIAIMNAGRIEQMDAPETIYRQPRTVFAARFMGLTNIVPVLHYADSKATTSIGSFPVSGEMPFLLLHPDYIETVPDTMPDALRGKIMECVFQGSDYRLIVRIGDVNLMFYTASRTSYSIGQDIYIQINPEGIVGLQA